MSKRYGLIIGSPEWVKVKEEEDAMESITITPVTNCVCFYCRKTRKSQKAKIQAWSLARDEKGRFLKMSKHSFVKASSKPSEHRELLRNHENRLRALELIVQKSEK